MLSCLKLSRRITSTRAGRSFATSTDLKRTVLYDWHVKNGGSMVDFEGWEMPVKYKNMTIIESHNHTRNKASLFDVSHMLQIELEGSDSTAFMEHLFPADVKEMKHGEAKYTIMMNQAGGIIDDTVITRKGDDKYYVVLNAGRTDVDLAHIYAQLEGPFKGKSVNLNRLSNSHSLVAVQGPQAEQVVASVLDAKALDEMTFFTSRHMDFKGHSVGVGRNGYTGEDGFELSVPTELLQDFVDDLFKHDSLQPAGLGARDTLRLEAGLCLYGHDLNENITAVQAVLGWTIGKRRVKEGGFIGDEITMRQMGNKKSVPLKRCGFMASYKEGEKITARPPAREGTSVFDSEDAKTPIGQVTSGTKSPCLGYNVGMAYVQTPNNKSGTELFVEIRNKRYPIRVCKMPFYQAKYKK